MAPEPQELPRTRNSPHQRTACTRCRRTKKKCLRNPLALPGPCVPCQKHGLANNCLFTSDKRSKNGKKFKANGASTPGGSVWGPQPVSGHREQITRDVHSIATVPAALDLLDRQMARLAMLCHQRKEHPSPAHPDHDQRFEADLSDIIQGAQGATSLLRIILRPPPLQIAHATSSQAFPQLNSPAPSSSTRAAPVVVRSIEDSPFLPRWQPQRDTFGDTSPPRQPYHLHSIYIAHSRPPLQGGGPSDQSSLDVSLQPRMEDIGIPSTMLVPHTAEQIQRLFQPSQHQSPPPGHRMISIPQTSSVEQLGRITTVFETIQQPAHPTIPQLPSVMGAAVGAPWVSSPPTWIEPLAGNANQSWTSFEETSGHWA